MPVSDLDPAQKQEGAPVDAETVAAPQATEEAAESAEKSGEGAGSPPEDQSAKADAIEIVVDGEEPHQEPKEATAPWVKELRKKYRDAEARAAELERKLAAQAVPAQAADPGPKPTFADCGYDEAVFEKKLESWNESQKAKKDAESQAAQRTAEAQRTWQAKVNAFVSGKEKLSKQVADYADAEKLVEAKLDPLQQGSIIAYAKNPALVVCALGRNPKLLEDLAKEKDPTRFAVEVANLEARVKTPTKTQAPPPDKPVRGSGAPSGTADSQLEKLRAQAEKSGDYTALNDYRREQRAQKR